MPDQGRPIHLPLWVKEEGLLRAPLCMFFDIGLCGLLGLNPSRCSQSMQRFWQIFSKKKLMYPIQHFQAELKFS